MTRLALIVFAALCFASSSCGGEAACDLPEQWSTATSGDGSTCQVNIFGAQEYAVYCGGASGSWDCACGPAVDDPPEFVSVDFCDMNGEERVCQAIERCAFPF